MLTRSTLAILSLAALSACQTAPAPRVAVPPATPANAVAAPAPKPQSVIAAPHLPNPDHAYAVVVSAATYADPAWKPVADTLVAKYHGNLIIAPKDFTDAKAQLAAQLASQNLNYVCFVAQPGEAPRKVVTDLNRMMRQLDADPYTDAIWGIVSGYDATDALRIARISKPLIIQTGGSGMGKGAVEKLPNGFAAYEGDKNKMTRWVDGKMEEVATTPNNTKALVDGLNTMAPDFWCTSAHASEKSWQVKYNDDTGGYFVCKDGQLFGLVNITSGPAYEIHSPNPKVYIAAGNCLIGNIPEKNCMAAAYIHCAGVTQMVGYTEETWFGYMGWGTLDSFNTGHYDCAEALFLNQQALLWHLLTEHPEVANVNYNQDEPQGENKIPRLANAKETQNLAGLLYDRDGVVLLGDPAWEARMPKDVTNYTETFTTEPDGTVTYTLTTTADGQWANRPVFAWLPQHVKEIKLLEGEDLKPVLTDNFLMFNMTGDFKKGRIITIKYTGKPL